MSAALRYEVDGARSRTGLPDPTGAAPRFWGGPRGYTGGMRRCRAASKTAERAF